MMNEQESYRVARRQVRRLKGFYIHLTVYVLVNALLLLTNLVFSPGVWWFYWPLLGWGTGVAAHAVSVFGLSGSPGKAWEERKIKELLDKQKARRAKE